MRRASTSAAAVIQFDDREVAAQALARRQARCRGRARGRSAGPGLTAADPDVRDREHAVMPEAQ